MKITLVFTIVAIVCSVADAPFPIMFYMQL